MNNQTVDTLFERQEIVSEVAGFFAPSARELSEALTIVGTKEGVGVQQHFQEIYRRQQHNRVQKPENAILAVTREYISYYRSAQSIASQLGALAIDIREIVNPNITLGDEIGDIKSKHRAFVRFVDLRDVYDESHLQTQQREVLDRPYFSKDTDTTQYISERLGEIKIKEARKLALESIDDQKNRSVFWLDTLKRLKAHHIAGPIIRASLRIES